MKRGLLDAVGVPLPVATALTDGVNPCVGLRLAVPLRLIGTMLAELVKLADRLEVPLTLLLMLPDVVRLGDALDVIVVLKFPGLPDGVRVKLKLPERLGEIEAFGAAGVEDPAAAATTAKTSIDNRHGIS